MYGMINDATCKVCNNCNDNLEHLFFQYDFSNYIWEETLDINSMNHRNQRWAFYIETIANDWKGEDLQQIMAKMRLGACVYAIWIE